jgi:arylsulfatase A-like enzyme
MAAWQIGQSLSSFISRSAPLIPPSRFQDAYLRKYRGRYDLGWDRLRVDRFARQKALGVMPDNAVMAPRRAEDRAWDSLSPDERRVFARYMEIYAAFVEHTDAQIGRLVTYLRETQEAREYLGRQPPTMARRAPKLRYDYPHNVV